MSKEESKGATGSAEGDPKAAMPEKKYKLKPTYPPIGDMMAYGSPEEQGKPKTFMQIVSGPAQLAVVFFISLIIFLHAPHHLSKGAERNTYGMNQKHPKYIKPKVIPYVPPATGQQVGHEDPPAKATAAEEVVQVETESHVEL